MAAGEGGPPFALGADAQQGHVLFTKAKLTHGQAGDEVGAGAQLADGDFLALEICGLLDVGVADEDVVEFIAGGAQNDEILRALRPGKNDSGASLDRKSVV